MVQLNDFEKVVFCFGNIDLFNGYEKYCKWQLIFCFGHGVSIFAIKFTGNNNFRQNTYRSSRPGVFYKKELLKPRNIFLKETPTQIFCQEFCKSFRNAFFTEDLRWLHLYLAQIFNEDSTLVWNSGKDLRFLESMRQLINVSTQTSPSL